jgi:hypothetical protein
MATPLLDDSPEVTDFVLLTLPEAREETEPPAPPTSLNRTLTGWEILFFTLIILLGTILVVDLWLLVAG